MESIAITESLILSVSLYREIAKIHNRIKITNEKIVEIIVNPKKRVGLPFLFLLSNLPFVGKKHDKTIVIRCNQKVIFLLKKMGFIDDLADDTKLIPNETDIAPFLIEGAKIIITQENVFSLVTAITKEAPVKMSEDLSALFISKVGEMFNNATEHSESYHVVGAKYFRNQKYTYCFSCYDAGVGIPEKVITTVNQAFTHKEAFQWAMKKGNSTANRHEMKIPRGLGLDLLHGFAMANDGVIRICSGKIFYRYTKKRGAEYYELEEPFEGTLYEMDIIADNNHKYILR